MSSHRQSRPGELIAEKIQVDFPRKPGPPGSFTWRGKTYPIQRVLRTWPDHGFGPLAKPGRWWQRRHRIYYHVLTDAGEEFEIYLDRGTEEWTLYRSL